MMIVALMFPVVVAAAVPPCAPKEALTGAIRAVGNDVLRLNVIDDPDRRTAEQYAKEHGETKDAIESRYAATGDLLCAHGNSQANVTIKRGLLTTAAHSVFNAKAFSKKFDPSSCKFVTMVDGKKKFMRSSRCSIQAGSPKKTF